MALSMNDWVSLKEQGNTALREGRGNAAERLYLDALPLAPASEVHLLHANLSHLYTKVGQFAKALIDTLGALEERTRGNLDADEAKLLTQALTALRFRFATGKPT